MGSEGPTDPNLALWRSIMHLSSEERRERMQHLPESECNRVRRIVEREHDEQRLENSIAGRDLYQMALDDPSEIIEDPQLTCALFGRTIHSEDENKMVKRITNDVVQDGLTLVSDVAGFDRNTEPLPLDAFKLVYCDLHYVDDGNATLDEIYQERLRQEELQTPAARARELVRDTKLRKARRNAKWMILAFENFSSYEDLKLDLKKEDWKEKLLKDAHDKELMETLLKQLEESEIKKRLLEKVNDKEHFERHWNQEEYKNTLERAWEDVSPAPPAWVRNILDTQQEWGFIYYMSREVHQKYGRNWTSIWNQILQHGSPLELTHASIHCQGRDNWMTLQRLEASNWPIFNPDENMAEDEDLRKHFKRYREENRSWTRDDEKKKKKRKRKDREENDDTLSPGFLRNTFIVIPMELIPGNLKREEHECLDPYWVWAYDADWEISEEETIYEGEKYQGRVKVAFWSINSWFYAARWEGVSLRDMWLKAQRHPEKLWIYYTKELEEWDHEPYV